MSWLSHLRTIATAASAFTVCCELVTQMLARALGFARQLGPALINLGDVRLYAPFSFLGWSFAWASVAPSLLVLSLCLTLVCALAAYAVSILVAKLEPITFADRSPWRGLAAWGELGHYGLLRDGGLAVGAVRRHALAKPHIVRSAARACVFLGKPEHTDDAVLAAIGACTGTLVLVEARTNLADRLGRRDVVRFAPGRSDTAPINPLLAIAGGPHAWDDARRLASALLVARFAAPTAVDAFALLMLDQLLCAPLADRTLSSLRRRLTDSAILAGDLCARWTPPPRPDAAPAIWEMVRVARTLRADPQQALVDFTSIDQALAGFADARLAHATDAHHLNLSEFVSAPAPQTLVLSLDVVGVAAAPLVHAVLAQLAASAASADFLLVVEAHAARLLAETQRALLPRSPNTVRLIQTADSAAAARMLGDAWSESAIVAIGPQANADAELLSRRAGHCRVFRTLARAIPRWRRLIFPTWIEQQVERLPPAALAAASPAEALLIAPAHKPVRMQVLLGGGATQFIVPAAPAPHDWSAPPIDPLPAQADAGPVDLSHPRNIATKLRRVLTRSVAKSAQTGAHPK